MLNSIYKFLFTNQDKTNQHVPTVDQVFGINKIPEPIPEPIKSIEKTETTETSLVWSNSEKKWVKNTVPSTEIVTTSQLVIKSIENVQEFKSKITEHIVAKQQIIEDKQEKLRQDELTKPNRTIVQWTPNNDLVANYNQASEIISKVPNLLKKIKQYQEKIISKQADVDKIQNKAELSPFDRFELIDYRKDILSEEGKISEIEIQIQHAQKYIDSPIFEEFALYLVEAENYINDVGLTGIFTANDILTSEAIYIKTKSLMDQLKYGKKNPILENRLQHVMKCFNMNTVHENSRGKNLREFNNFFIENKTNDPLYIFDKMDVHALNDASAMKTIIKNTAVGMIDNQVNETSIASNQDNGLNPATF